MYVIRIWILPYYFVQYIGIWSFNPSTVSYSIILDLLLFIKFLSSEDMLPSGIKKKKKKKNLSLILAEEDFSLFYELVPYIPQTQFLSELTVTSS